MFMKTLFLYTTLGCHLCEEAKALAWPVLERYGYRLQEVEISDQSRLMDLYAIRIPVLAKAEFTEGLGWPFSQQQLANYLEGHEA